MMYLQEPFSVTASDGYSVKGFFWRDGGAAQASRPVVIINAATSVICRYYFRFASFLFENKFDVVTYDYRGIGESRPSNLRGFNASWIDWGSLDFEAIIQYTKHSFPGQPLHVVAHSVGGFILGLAESNYKIERIFTIGAQYAYWRDYKKEYKAGMIIKWHFFMPLVALLFGYFPGKKLGWLEDTPKGVVGDWAFSRAKFEDTWRGFSSSGYSDKKELVTRFTKVTAPILAVSVTDDQYGTVPAIERLLTYFTSSEKTHFRITPESINESAIGHFGFFHSSFREKLWHLPLDWLKYGNLSCKCPGDLVSP